MRSSFKLKAIACLSLIAGCAASIFSQSLDTLLPFSESGKWGFINTKGAIVFPSQFESVLYWGCARYGKVKQDGVWHFITRKGQKLPMPIAGVPESFNDSILVIRSIEGKYLVSESGRKIMPQKFTDIKSLGDGYFSYYLGDSCGLAHLNRGIITSTSYDLIHYYGMPGFEVISCDKSGFIDLNGKTLLEPIYEIAGRNTNGLIQVYLGEASKTGIYNTVDREWIIGCNWDMLIDSNMHFLVLEDERGSFLFNRKCKVFIQNQLRQAELVDEVAIIESNNGKGIIDVERGVVLNPQYSSINKEHNTYLAQENGAWKLYTNQGQSISKDSFISVLSLSAPAWILEREDDWVLIDTAGNYLLDNIHNPEVLGNKVKYYKDSTMVSFTVDQRGKVVSKRSFDNVVRLQVSNYRSWSFKANSEIENPTSTEPASLWFKDERLKKWGLKHADGRILVEPVYDYVINDRTYNCTYVYLRTAENTLKFAGDFYSVGARAGLVDNESGKLLVEPRFLDIFITGPPETPLFFGITMDFQFKRVIPEYEDFLPTYSWVDKAEKHPVRALALGSKPKRSNSHQGMTISRLDMIQRIQNPDFNYHKLNITSLNRNGLLTFSDQRWVYLFPHDVNPKQYFSEAEPFNNRLAIARKYKSNLYGLLNNQGYEVLPFEYSNIRRSVKYRDTLYFLSRSDTSLFLINNNDDLISVDKKNEIWEYDGEYIYLKQPFSLGFTKNEQQVFMFENAWKLGKMSEGFISVYSNYKWKYYKADGQRLNEKLYSKAYEFHKGKALVKEKRKWFFIDSYGEAGEILPWKNMKPMFDGGFIASDGRRWFITDEDGNALHEKGFLNVKPFKNCRYVLVKEGSRWGLYSATGKALTKNRYQRIKYLGDDLFSLQKGNRVYLKNGETKEKKLKRYTHISETSEGILALRSKVGWHAADTSLELLGNEIFRRLQPFQNGYSVGISKGQFCLVDLRGEIVFSTSNRLIGNYSNGCILSYDKSKQMYYYLNESGSMLFAKGYLKAMPFENKRAWVKTYFGWGCIDDSGEWIINPKYYAVKKMANEAFVVKSDAVYGVCDASGMVILKPVFDEIDVKENRLLFAQKGKDVVWKYINGELIFENQVQKQLAINP